MQKEGQSADVRARQGANELPTLTDGTITLRPWRLEDHAGLRTHSGSSADELVDARAGVDDYRGQRLVRFVIEHQGDVVGFCNIDRSPNHEAGAISWGLIDNAQGHGLATRAVRALSDWVLTDRDQQGLGLTRIEARVDADNQSAMRVATRSGLRREGVQRIVPGTGISPTTSEYVVFARLSIDPPLTDPASFRALLNSFLPRKRVIAQMLIRDDQDRVLLCQLTYKNDWDLPGGVVEVGESPHECVSREVQEELRLEITPGDLLLTDWLPAWSGWDDAVCLVFDGGQHPPDLVAAIVRQEREIRAAAFCTPSQVAERTKDFTARRINSALARVGGSGPGFTHSGGPLH